MVHLTNISKNYGSQFLYKNASFQVQVHDKIGLVGSNGSGKSTLFRLIVGEESVDEGEVNISDKWIVGYFSPDFDRRSTAITRRTI
jgi:ATP-binding cassette subfamily F protein 3